MIDHDTDHQDGPPMSGADLRILEQIDALLDPDEEPSKKSGQGSRATSGPLLPNEATVLPGQSDQELALLLATWAKSLGRKIAAVALLYAGHLSMTAPDEGPDAQAAWLASCTPRQQHLLRVAAERARTKRRAVERAEYASEKAAAGQGPVRAYVTDLSSEDRAERRRLQNAEAARRSREKAKLLQPKIAKGDADELDAMFANFDAHHEGPT